jgi:transposase
MPQLKSRQEVHSRKQTQHARAGNSPDMNPIENLWSILKKLVGKMDCSTEERMVTNVIQEWFHDSGVRNI